MAKFDLKKLDDAKSFKISYLNTDNIDSVRVKKIRNNLGVTQNVFGSILGVTKKTVEKWEQGKNKVSGTAATLIALIEQNPEIVSILYKVSLPEAISEAEVEESTKNLADDSNSMLSPETKWEEKDGDNNHHRMINNPVLQG